MLSPEKAEGIIEGILREPSAGQNLDDVYYPADIAEAIDQIEDDDLKLAAFNRLGVETGSQVLPLVDDHTRDMILRRTPAEDLGGLIGEMESDDAADILGEVEDQRAEDILDTVSDEVDQEVSRLLEYDEESAGGIMQTELLSVPEDIDVKRAIDMLRARADEVGEIHNVFVVDHLNKLKGVVPISQLILKAESTLIRNLIEGQPLIYATLDTDQENVAEQFKRYDIVSLPVVDDTMTLVGRVLIDDIVDVIEEENSEDMLMMAGAGDEALTQTHTVFEMVRYRLPWLGTSLFSGFISGALIWEFKMAIAEAIALVAFIPVVMGMGGNVGSQSSALVIRGLATGKIGIGSLRAYVYKELKIGLALGLACGGVAGVAAELWQGSPVLGVIVGFSIFFAISMAALLGVTIPLLFRWLKIDPAIAGGPIVLAVNDISGVLIFFMVATAMLGYLR